MTRRLAAMLAMTVLQAACVGAIGDAGGELDESYAPGDTPQLAAGTKAIVVGTGDDTLALRDKADRKGAILGGVVEDNVVDVVAGPELGFFQVTFEGTTGWVIGRYLAPADGAPDPAGTPDAGTPDPGDPDPVDPPATGGTQFLLPWTGGVTLPVTGGHDTSSHAGKGEWAWDFGLAYGTNVRAAHDGTVRAVRGDSTRGGCDQAFANDANYVVVDRGDGFETLYLHLSSASVTVGQTVTRGTILGKSGETGWACGPHLHYQVQQSPSGGGTTSWWNQSVHEYFHDTGAPVDPTYPNQYTSANAK